MPLFGFEENKPKPVMIGTATKDTEPPKNQLFRKLFVFFLALMGAGILWFLSALNHNYTSYIKYPIRIVYDGNKYIPLAKLPSYVSVTATGYGWDFLRKTISVKQDPVLLKPSNLPSQKHFTSDELHHAFSRQLQTIKVNFFDTDTLFFNFDLVASKKVYVTVDTSKCTLENSTVPFTFKLTPSEINLKGSKTLLSEISDTVRIKITERELELGFKEVFEIPASNHPFYKSDATEVEVTIEKK